MNKDLFIARVLDEILDIIKQIRCGDNKINRMQEKLEEIYPEIIDMKNKEFEERTDMFGYWDE